ncbi:MAG: flavodoxin family protein [Rhodopseudomonas palustris]|nr:flavodoxin family protein [Rhodopseudomonas palustris]
MKVLAFSGSPRENGNTDRLALAVLEGAKAAGAKTTLYRLNEMNIRGRQACNACRKKFECAVKDDMTALYGEMVTADAVILASPVYMFQMTGQTKLFVDRLFPLLESDFTSRLPRESG